MDSAKHQKVNKNQNDKLVNKLQVREFENKLIMEIKNHACLYAKNETSYSNKFKRDEAWKDVAMILCKTVEECQKKWTALRDAFRAYFRVSSNIASGSGAVAPIKWIHFEALKFIIPYIKVPGDDCGNFPNMEEEMICDSDICNTDIQFIELSTQPTSTYSSSASLSSTDLKKKKTPNNKRRNNTKFDDDEVTLDKVLKSIENSTTVQRSSMELFLENIAVQVKHFNKKKSN